VCIAVAGRADKPMLRVRTVTGAVTAPSAPVCPGPAENWRLSASADNTISQIVVNAANAANATGSVHLLLIDCPSVGSRAADDIYGVNCGNGAPRREIANESINRMDVDADVQDEAQALQAGLAAPLSGPNDEIGTGGGGDDVGAEGAGDADATMSVPTSGAVPATKLRTRVALMFGYLGTRFQGLQKCVQPCGVEPCCVACRVTVTTHVLQKPRRAVRGGRAGARVARRRRGVRRRLW